ncbi:MAG: folate family ECF transporter S component [Clostridia bacterium]|nr:folate family ECF transporter S component [Clostridia bacterium]
MSDSRTPRLTAMGSIKRLVIASMLVAMSVVLGILCKNFMNFVGGLLRITFENLPILLAGIFLGPLVGGLVGVASDLVSYFLSPQIYPPNLWVTAGAFCVGVISGIVARYIVKKRGIKQIIVSSISAHFLGSMVIKTIGLYSFYGIAVLVRIPLYLVIASLEITLICILWRQASFRRLFEKL